MGNVFTINLALFGWIPVVLVMFATLPPRRAMIASYVLGWLLLPPIRLILPGIPDYSKWTATSYGVLIGTLLFDFGRYLRFRPRWFDLPIAAMLVCPFVSMLSNGFGPYDSFSESLNQTIIWGLPYFIGRLYLDDLEGLKEMAIGIFAGGLGYILPCLLEIRISPLLMYWVYGFSGNLSHDLRWGGYRPVVFLATGLELGMWMAAASLVGFGLWFTRALTRLGGAPTGLLLSALVATTILCKSTGAIGLMLLGIGVLWGIRRTQRLWPVWALLAVMPTYEVARLSGTWSARGLVDLTASYISPERAHSLKVRLDAEDLLIAKALQRPMLGWGGHNRDKVFDENGRNLTVTDGMWIIELGHRGLIGLAVWTAALLLPVALVVRRFPAPSWSTPEIGPAVVLAVLIALYGIDCLSNAMFNPLYMVVMGGLAMVAANTATVAGRSGKLSDYDRLAEELATLTDALRAESHHPDGAVPGTALALRSAAEPDPAPELPRSCGSLAAALVAHGRDAVVAAAWLEAISQLDEAIAADPEDDRLRHLAATSRNDVAWLLAKDPTATPAEAAYAVGVAEEAVALVPDDVACWNTLGAAYLRAGDPAAAVAALRQASELGEEPTAFDALLLAIAYNHLGESDAADQWWGSALELLRDPHLAASPDLVALRDEAATRLFREPQTLAP